VHGSYSAVDCTFALFLDYLLQVMSEPSFQVEVVFELVMFREKLHITKQAAIFRSTLYFDSVTR